MNNWGFPEMGLPRNHPFTWDVPPETIYFGVPPLMETPIYDNSVMDDG